MSATDLDDLDLADLSDTEDLPLPAGSTPFGSPKDPASLGWPPMLPIELALRERPVKDVVQSYGLDIEAWRRLCGDAAFQAELKARLTELRQDGMSFKLKARLQAEELLKTSWTIIHHDKTPFAVKADLIKHTVRVAGLDASKDQGPAGPGGGVVNALQININLGGD